MKIVFFGSSWFSLYALKACLKPPHQLLLVVTTPDQRKGRGLQLSANPVKEFAEANGLPVAAPDKLKDPSLMDKVRLLMPDVFVVFSYGKMIPSSWLGIPSRLCLNVHPSVLPKYRGAAPIQWALLNGDHEAGLSIAEVTSQLDSGDIFYQSRISIHPNEDAQSLTQRLAEESALALESVLNQLAGNKLTRTTQNDSESCYARKLTKEDGKIDWQQPAEKIHNQIRALIPWPAAYTHFNGTLVQVLKAKLLASRGEKSPKENPGVVHAILKNQGLEVQTGSGTILIEQLKPEGKKAMAAVDFAHGARIQTGSCFKSL